MGEFFFCIFCFLSGIWITTAALQINITPDVYEQAAVKCNMNEGIKKVAIPAIGDRTVSCVNGAKFVLEHKQ